MQTLAERSEDFSSRFIQSSSLLLLSRQLRAAVMLLWTLRRKCSNKVIFWDNMSIGHNRILQKFAGENSLRILMLGESIKSGANVAPRDALDGRC